MLAVVGCCGSNPQFPKASWVWCNVFADSRELGYRDCGLAESRTESHSAYKPRLSCALLCGPHRKRDLSSRSPGGEGDRARSGTSKTSGPNAQGRLDGQTNHTSRRRDPGNESASAPPHSRQQAPADAQFGGRACLTCYERPAAGLGKGQARPGPRCPGRAGRGGRAGAGAGQAGKRSGARAAGARRRRLILGLVSLVDGHHYPYTKPEAFCAARGVIGDESVADAGLIVGSVARDRALEPIPWTTYFERELFLTCHADPGVTFHAYLTSPVDKGPLFVMHHGAGSSGLTFAVAGAKVRKRLPSAGILAIDCRGHGSTVSPEGSALDLTLETLSADLHTMLQATRQQMGWEKLPDVILVGHSLGGAVVTDLAMTGKLGASLLGYAVLDVVEGSAMDALHSMHTYLSTRPGGFASVQAAIDWHIRSRTVRNPISARTSVPALLSLMEGVDAARPWRWRTNLSATQPFWEGWFVGLSKKFLRAKGGKLLLLAGTDRLDTELTIGQMQGQSRHVSPDILLTSDAQGNMPCRCIQKPATLSTRTFQSRRPFLWQTFTEETTGVLWCCRPRFRTF